MKLKKSSIMNLFFGSDHSEACHIFIIWNLSLFELTQGNKYYFFIKCETFLLLKLPSPPQVSNGWPLTLCFGYSDIEEWLCLPCQLHKQTQFRVCFHLWCELTSTIRCNEMTSFMEFMICTIFEHYVHNIFPNTRHNACVQTSKRVKLLCRS